MTTNARRALAIGSRRAREEGILITASPGVSFSDVFDDDAGTSTREEGHPPRTDDVAAEDENTMATDVGNEERTTATTDLRRVGSAT